MRIGIFGGSFNPPHNMHENIAKDLIKKDYLDKVIFVPTGMKYEYKFNLIQNETRYELLKIITDKYKELSVSTFEFQEEVVYTYETLDHFKEKYKEDEIFFICGADNLSYIDKWRNGEYILKNYKIIVISRNTDDLESILKKYENYKETIQVADITPEDISSTNIRELIKEKKEKELSNYLDPDVLNYIIKNKLYQEEEEE